MTDPSSIRQHRPLSPHLQVYRPQITSAMSILHRISGVVLFFGLLAIALWLWAVAYSPALFECIHACFTSTLGTIGMIGWTLAFFYHLFNGVRHLLWDTGKGFALDEVTLTGISAMAFTLISVAAIWFLLLGGKS